MSTDTVRLARRHNAGTLRGIACLMLALASFAVMDVLIKWLSTGYGTMQIVFFRSVFALVPVAVLVARMGGPAALKTRRPGGHMIRPDYE